MKEPELFPDEDRSSQMTSMKRLRKTISQDLARRFQLDDHLPDDVSTQQLACFLDPRHKNLLFEDEEIREDIRNEAKKLFENNIKTAVEDTGAKSVLDILLGEDDLENSDEFTKYLCVPEIDRNLDPLFWWKDNQKTFPSIAKIASQILSIPATSVDSERDFSCAGNIVSAKSSCLIPENVNVLVFQHQNRKFVYLQN